MLVTMGTLAVVIFIFSVVVVESPQQLHVEASRPIGRGSEARPPALFGLAEAQGTSCGQASSGPRTERMLHVSLTTHFGFEHLVELRLLVGWKLLRASTRAKSIGATRRTHARLPGFNPGLGDSEDGVGVGRTFCGLPFRCGFQLRSIRPSIPSRRPALCSSSPTGVCRLRQPRPRCVARPWQRVWHRSRVNRTERRSLQKMRPTKAKIAQPVSLPSACNRPQSLFDAKRPGRQVSFQLRTNRVANTLWAGARS
jgi:hypothetical protein